jgi:hypothetical protein
MTLNEGITLLYLEVSGFSIFRRLQLIIVSETNKSSGLELSSVAPVDEYEA